MLAGTETKLAAGDEDKSLLPVEDKGASTGPEPEESPAPVTRTVRFLHHHNEYDVEGNVTPYLPRQVAVFPKVRADALVAGRVAVRHQG